MARDRRWDAFDKALRALMRQARAAGLDRMTERELTDAVEEEKQALRRERREREEGE